MDKSVIFSNDNDNDEIVLNILDDDLKYVTSSNVEQHRPHQLFCEMDELQPNLEWKEAARWLKFEEDVELGGRWSKPHVATLQLHSLFELRSCLMTGATLLDFPGEDLPSIVGWFKSFLIYLNHY